MTINILDRFCTGIYMGNNRVIHFTRPAPTKEVENNKKIRKPHCKNDCNYNPNTQGGIVKSCIYCFLQGHALFRFEYEASIGFVALTKPGSCSTVSSDSTNMGIKRAMEMLETDFGEYHPIENNCEAFALYGKTGCRRSLQAVSKKAQAKIGYEIFAR